MINNFLAQAGVTPDQGAGGYNTGVGTDEITNPILGSLGKTSGTAFFQGFFGKLITLSLIAGTIIFLFMLISGGIAWISSGGDKGALEAAKSRVTNALIGIVVLFSVYAVVNLVSYFFGDINLLSPALTPVTP